MSVKENRTTGILITLSGGACWGLSGCFGQYLFQEKGITAEWLVTMRLFFAGLLLIVLGLILMKKKMWDVWKNPVD
ncbi:MAG: EamA family transporter, partial [Anaerotignum sp.]|nr:EamA family transporter [Anaerotignum sp.]